MFRLISYGQASRIWAQGLEGIMELWGLGFKGPGEPDSDVVSP